MSIFLRIKIWWAIRRYNRGARLIREEHLRLEGLVDPETGAACGSTVHQA